MGHYKSYPKIVGETGGKNFIFVHPSAPALDVATAIVRGAFEYQGQKCSAGSRAYIPASLWKEVKEYVGDMLKEIKMGDVQDFTNFINAVIDEASFDNIMSYIDYAKQSPDAEIVFGGNGDKSVGYFVEPTVIQTTDPMFKSMVEEIFGPVITIYVYDDNKYEETLELCDRTSPYGLTGSILHVIVMRSIWHSINCVMRRVTSISTTNRQALSLPSSRLAARVLRVRMIKPEDR